MRHLGLFAKFWQPGRVKTRLARTIGEQRACDIYRSFLFHLIDTFAHTADTRSVAFTPTEFEPQFRQSIASSWQLVPQSPGDLGQRMKSFFQQQFAGTSTSDPSSLPSSLNERRVKPPVEVDRIIIIGADCPQLDSATLDLAFDALLQHDVVLGPSTDGGYYLLGMRSQCFDLFAGIQWSTETVLRDTLRRVQQQSLSHYLLSPLTDVDDESSLRQLIAQLDRGSQSVDDPLAARLTKLNRQVKRWLDHASTDLATDGASDG